MAELIKTYTTTKFQHPSYTRIQEFLAKFVHTPSSLLFIEFSFHSLVVVADWVMSDHRLWEAITVATPRPRHILELTCSLQMSQRTCPRQLFPSLHDNGVILLEHPDNLVLTKDIHRWAFTFDYYLFKDWWGLNELHLTSPTHPIELV